MDLSICEGTFLRVVLGRLSGLFLLEVLERCYRLQGFGFWGLGFLGSGFLYFKACGFVFALDLGVLGFGLRGEGLLRIRLLGLGFWGLGLTGLGFRV